MLKLVLKSSGHLFFLKVLLTELHLIVKENSNFSKISVIFLVANILLQHSISQAHVCRLFTFSTLTLTVLALLPTRIFLLTISTVWSSRQFQTRTVSMKIWLILGLLPIIPSSKLVSGRWSSVILEHLPKIFESFSYSLFPVIFLHLFLWFAQLSHTIFFVLLLYSTFEDYVLS